MAKHKGKGKPVAGMKKHEGKRKPVVGERGIGPHNLDPPPVGKAGNYAILAEQGITLVHPNVPPAVTGDIGLWPAPSSDILGFSLVLDRTHKFATSIWIAGKAYAADYADPTPGNLNQAVNDMGAAYNYCNSPTGSGYQTFSNKPPASNLGGSGPLTPGFYTWKSPVSAVSIPTNVTFYGGPTDVWILDMAGLNMSSGTEVVLTGGALAENIFWQVAGPTTIGAGAIFKGILLASTQVTLQNGATTGRILTQGAVSLQQAMVQP